MPAGSAGPALSTLLPYTDETVGLVCRCISTIAKCVYERGALIDGHALVFRQRTVPTRREALHSGLRARAAAGGVLSRISWHGARCTLGINMQRRVSCKRIRLGGAGDDGNRKSLHERQVRSRL